MVPKTALFGIIGVFMTALVGCGASQPTSYAQAND